MHGISERPAGPRTGRTGRPSRTRDQARRGVAEWRSGSCAGWVSPRLDDFGVDTDQSGWAHIAYSHDAPDLGGSGAYTGYAVQTAGTVVARPN